MKRRQLSITAVWAGVWLGLMLGVGIAQQNVNTAPNPSLSPLRVGMAPNYPPIIFKKEGRLSGVEADLAQGLPEALGRQVELVELDWEALIPALETGQIDVIMSGMSITEARAQRVRFVSHYLRVGQMAIFRKADNLQFGATSLLPRTTSRAGFVAGTTGAAYVQAHLSQAQHVPLPSADAGLEALRTKTIDLFIHDGVTAWRVGENEETDVLTSSFDPLTDEHLAWAVRQTDDALHRDLETVLERWRRSDYLQKVFHKWLRFRAG